MTTLHEAAAAAATFARRDQAQSLNAVKLALVNAETRGLSEYIAPGIGLRVVDLKSVVEQAEGTQAREEQREAVAQRFENLRGWSPENARANAALVRATPLDATPLAAELEKARGEVDSLQASLSAEVERHLATTRERDETEEHFYRATSAACGWAWDFAASQDFTERYGRHLLWAQAEDLRARLAAVEKERDDILKRAATHTSECVGAVKEAEKERDEATDRLNARGMSVAPDLDMMRLLKQRDEARADAATQNRACAEEMSKREGMSKNWDQMVASVKQHHERAEKAEAACAALRAGLDELATIAEGLLEDAALRDWAGVDSLTTQPARALLSAPSPGAGWLSPDEWAEHAGAFGQLCARVGMLKEALRAVREKLRHDLGMQGPTVDAIDAALAEPASLRGWLSPEAAKEMAMKVAESVREVFHKRLGLMGRWADDKVYLDREGLESIVEEVCRG